jgi:hypothetical protein
MQRTARSHGMAPCSPQSTARMRALWSFLSTAKAWAWPSRGEPASWQHRNGPPPLLLRGGCHVSSFLSGLCHCLFCGLMARAVFVARCVARRGLRPPVVPALAIDARAKVSLIDDSCARPVTTDNDRQHSIDQISAHATWLQTARAASSTPAAACLRARGHCTSLLPFSQASARQRSRQLIMCGSFAVCRHELVAARSRSAERRRRAAEPAAKGYRPSAVAVGARPRCRICPYCRWKVIVVARYCTAVYCSG